MNYYLVDYTYGDNCDRTRTHQTYRIFTAGNEEEAIHELVEYAEPNNRTVRSIVGIQTTTKYAFDEQCKAEDNVLKEKNQKAHWQKVLTEAKDAFQERI